MTVSTVLGLDVSCDAEVPFLQGATAAPTGRALRVHFGVAPDWPASARLISDERERDGSVNFQIEDGGEAGYRIGGPRFGASTISVDGTRLWGVAGRGGIAAWQRMLVAQALPFVAVMRGLEVLHASAVAGDGGAVAFSGPSGTGKTSLALALVRRGATLLTDDVLVLERAGDKLLAHPGTPVAGVAAGEAARLDRDGGGSGPVLAADARERIARTRLAAAPQPLQALFLLERSADASEPRFEPTADPQLLLSSTFNLLLTSPGRLSGLLEVCATLARRRVERVVFGPGAGPEELAAAIEARLGRAA